MLTFIRINRFNPGILTQAARLHYNHASPLRLQENFGKKGIFSAERSPAIAKITTLYFEMALTSRGKENCVPRTCVRNFAGLISWQNRPIDFILPVLAYACKKCNGNDCCWSKLSFFNFHDYKFIWEEFYWL